MKLNRLLVAAIGLACLVLAYVTGSIIFLGVAVIAFIGGLYLMGANKRPVQKENDQENTTEKNRKK